MIPQPAPTGLETAPARARARRATDFARALSWPAWSALAGIAIAGVLLWLALRGTSTADLAAMAKQLQFRWVVLAMLLYWAGLVLRTGRWRILLQGLEPAPLLRPDRYNRLGEVLLVGYAANNVLPGGLGELFRANHAGKQLPLTPAAVFGTIVIERLLDAIVVAAALCIGIAVLGLVEDASAASSRYALAVIAACASMGVLAAAATIWGVMRFPELLLRLPPFAKRPARELRYGLGCFGYAQLPRLAAISLAIWLVEGTAIWSLVRAAGVALGPGQTAVLVGALSLAALLPAATAHLGSYQLIFGLCLAGFGLPAAVGVFGASLVQVFLLGPVMLAGLVLYARPHALAAMWLSIGGQDSAARAG